MFMSCSLGFMMVFVYYFVDAKSLRHVWVLTFNPCGLLLSLCLLIHTTMIHAAAVYEVDVLFTPTGPQDVPPVTCCVTSSPSGCFSVDKFHIVY